MFTHEKLTVYQRSREWFVLSQQLIEEVPTGNSELINQLKRAALSISLNIAEGAGKVSPNDKRKYFGIARGSALECAAIIDIIPLVKECNRIDLMPAKNILYEIVCMLSSMCRKDKVEAK